MIVRHRVRIYTDTQYTTQYAILAFLLELHLEINRGALPYSEVVWDQEINGILES